MMPHQAKVGSLHSGKVRGIVAFHGCPLFTPETPHCCFADKARGWFRRVQHSIVNITVGTNIIVDPEKYFRELISEKNTDFIAG